MLIEVSVERKVFAASGVTSVLRGSFKEIVTNLDMNILYYDNIKSDENWLPLSINILYDDLIKSIDIYEEMVKNHVLLENYSNAIDALSQPTPVGLSW